MGELWKSLIDVIKAIRDKQVETQKTGEELGDIPASHYDEANVSQKELETLEKSLEKLEGKEPKELEEPEINNGRAGLVSRYKAGNAGGSQGKTIVNSNEVKTAEKPDNELVI